MPCDFYSLPHEGIQSLTPYTPGKSVDKLAEELGLKDIIKLASNENPAGCSALVKEALNKLSLQQISTYVVAREHPLRKKIAAFHDVDPRMITIANGSDSLIPSLQTTFALHRDKHVLTHQYAFATYQIAARTLGIPVVTTKVSENLEVHLDEIIQVTNKNTALVFIANPNNPTGLLILEEKIQHLLENIPDSTLLVLDEAYIDYVDKPQRPNMIPLLEKYPNLVILRTFSKSYGLAGLRIGYAISNPAITALLEKMILPFTVNYCALIAAGAALEDTHFISDGYNENLLGRQQLVQGLQALGFDSIPSSGNFITFDCKKDALPIYQALEKYGIIVRPLHPYQLPNFLRVTIGRPEQIDRFLATLEDIIHDK